MVYHARCLVQHDIHLYDPLWTRSGRL